MVDQTEGNRPQSEGAADETSIGMEPNVGGALCYLLGILTGILFYVIEKENDFIRFHAMQSIIVFGGFFVLSTSLSFITGFLSYIPVFGWIAAVLLGLVSLLLLPVIFVLWLFLMYKAFNGERYELPVVGKYANEYM